jgi:opacity protein-like surface antigen
MTSTPARPAIRRTSIAAAALALGLSGLAVADPAEAGGFDEAPNRLRSHRSSAIPVPAPMPVAEYGAKWYLRGDIGVGYRHDRGAKENGLLYGVDDFPTPFGTSPAWMMSDVDFTSMVSVGVGYYWNSRFRTDLTLERVQQTEGRMRGNYTYIRHDPDPFTGVLTPTNNQVNGESEDRLSIHGGAVMFNGYLDLASRGDLTPYVGLGIGVAFNRVSRTHTTEETECDLAGLPPCAVQIPRPGWSGSKKSDTATLAAAMTAGFTYSLSESTMLDVNYRLLYVGGTESTIQLNGNASTFSVGDMFEHQLRAGLRWNIQ